MFRRLHIQILIASLSLLIAGSIIAADDPPRIVFMVPDISAPSGDTAAYLDIYIDNFLDTIAGFQFVLISTRPDLVKFNFNDGGYDTVGTLLAGFEYVHTIDTLHDQSAIWFRCIANSDPWDGYNTPGIAPQQGGVAVRIPVNTAPYPDTSQDLLSLISVGTPFDFSDPWGYSIGVLTETYIDTFYYQCLQWESDSCLEWIEVDPDSSEYDLMYIDTGLTGYLDTTQVITDEGSVQVLPRVICDWNDSESVDIADLTCLVDYLFGAYDAQSCPYQFCDINRSGGIDVSDLTYLVDYLFGGGPPPH